jgi:hypothetical protein
MSEPLFRLHSDPSAGHLHVHLLGGGRLRQGEGSLLLRRGQFVTAHCTVEARITKGKVLYAALCTGEGFYHYCENEAKCLLCNFEVSLPKEAGFPKGKFYCMAIMRPLCMVERWTSSEERASTAMGVVSVPVWYRTTPRPLCIVVCYYLHMVFDL